MSNPDDYGDLPRWELAQEESFLDRAQLVVYARRATGKTIAQLSADEVQSQCARSPTDLDQGHCWIEVVHPLYQVTYSVFGNNQLERGRGLLEHVESRSHARSDASCTFGINARQMKVLDGVLSDYRERGERAWTEREPAAAFVNTVLERTLGVRLNKEDGDRASANAMANALQSMRETLNRGRQQTRHHKP